LMAITSGVAGGGVCEFFLKDFNKYFAQKETLTINSEKQSRKPIKLPNKNR